MNPHSHFRRHAHTKRSSALIITLIVLLLVTLLVVSLASMIGLERTSTHESFENVRAREFATIAVDEVVATMRDNESSLYTNQWAAAPGKIEYFAGPTATSATTINLYSGAAAGATASTGQVDLNAPVLGSTNSFYPIISTNTEYPTATALPMGWVEVLQDGTTLRPGSTSGGTTANPVVGRYAYWVDTETSKANINTAGRGQTLYNFDGTNFYLTAASTNDIQNLSGSPSRVDLSQLDGGITSAQSLSTFHFTYGGYWLPAANDAIGAMVNPTAGSPYTAPFPAIPTNGPGVASQGMQRFSSIQQWSQMTNDLILGTAVTPISAAQVEQNKFYLTTRSWSPEVTPWGFNKLWLQANNVNVYPPAIVATSPSTSGNKINGKGVSTYPATLSAAQNWSPNSIHAYGGSSPVSEPRYYATPWLPQTNSSFPNDLQFPGQYMGSQARAAMFVSALMVQFNRTDWPGFSGKSFVGKYGQAECEDLAYNILHLYDSGAYTGGESSMIYGFSIPNQTVDNYGYYGSALQMTVDGRTRLFGGVGEWPYYSQVSAQFIPVGTKGGNVTSTNTSVYSGVLTNFIGAVKTVYYTKSPSGVGFAPTWTGSPASSLPNNIAIIPSAEIYYPQGFKNPYANGWSYFGTNTYDGTSSIIDVEAYATGVLHGTNVTYGTTNTTDPEPGTLNANYHPYYYGVLDHGPGLGVTSSWPFAFGSTPSTQTPGYYTLRYPTIYMGPFDQNSNVTDVQFRCRFVLAHQNPETLDVATEVAPLAYNSVGATNVANEGACFTNLMSPSSYATYAPSFHFGMNDLGNANLLFTGDTVDHIDATYEVSDPRVYRYLSDWTERLDSTGLKAGTSSIYTGTFLDPLTGVKGDSSKFAWPDVGAHYAGEAKFYNANYFTGSGLAPDPRLKQTGNHITALPGIGWLSCLPLNCESSQGSPTVGVLQGTNTVYGSGTGNGKPIPWRTVSLEASTSGKLPDWLLMQAVAIAYDQTYCSQTEGKMNVNMTNVAFPAIPIRTKPLQALMKPASYQVSVDNPTINATTITADIAKGPSGGSTYISPAVGNLPSDILMYPGQLCQFSSMAGGGTNQWQRESLMRNIAGAITTQCNDFKVHVVAQAVKQVAYSGNPTSDFVVTGEQRMSAIVSRTPNLGPDNLPDSGDEPVYATNYTVGSSTPAATTITTGIGTTVKAGIPPFKYVISDINYVNN